MLQNNPAGELELALRIRALVEGQNAIVGLGRSFLDINRSVEQLMLGLKSVSGSIEGANNEFSFLTSVAQKTGLSIETLGNNYLKLTAASKGTLLEGERVRTLFSQTSDALMKLGSDSTNTTRAMNALAQMMSKGQIYSEELKGQLAEAIPGALNIMSRALGLSVQEMLNLMEQGLLTSDALVLFGNQLKTEFSSGTENVRTFNQVINDVINQWTLLMKGLGDTGAWSLLKTVIGGVGTSMDMLAGAAGAGLGVALAKAAIGLKNITSSSKESVTALVSGVSAHRANASAALDHARATVTSAQAAQAEARAIALSAEAQYKAGLGTIVSEKLARNLSAARTDLSIKTSLLTVAEEKLVAAEQKVIATTTLTSRVTGLLFGPVGIIASAIITGLSFAGMFGDIGEKADSSKQNLDEYSKSVKDMTNAELVAAIAEQDAAAKKAKSTADRKEALLSLMEVEKSLNGNSLNYFQNERNREIHQKQMIETSRQISEAKGKEEEAERKLDFTRAALVARIGEMINVQDALSKQSSELRAKQVELHEKTELLRAGLKDGTVTYGEYYEAQMKEIEIASKLRDSDAKLTGVSKELLKTEELIQEQAESNVAAYGGLTKGSQEYNDAVANEANRIRERFKELSKLTETLVDASIATRNLKAQTEAHNTVSKSITDSLEKEAKLTGDLSEQRRLLVARRLLEAEADKEQIVLMMQEQTAIQAEIVLRERELELGTKKENVVKQEIGSLKNQLTAKNAEIEARKNSVEYMRLEAVEAIASSKTMSDGMRDVEDAIKNTNIELAKQKEARTQAAMAGKLIEEMIPLDEAILALEQRLTDLSKDKAIVMRQGWESIGQSQEEAATGMDFQTRRMIDAFGELAGKGNLTSQQLTSSFTDVLAKANTTTELLAIGEQIVKLQQTGKYNTDLLQLMFKDVAIKLTDVKDAADPATIALSKMGLNVPEQMERVTEQMKAQVDILTPQKVGIEASNQAFMKYAEQLIKTKLAGGDVDKEQLKVDASARGLSVAVTDLNDKLQKEHDAANPLTGALAALKDITEKNAREHERAATASSSYYSAQLKVVEGAIKVAKAKGDEAEVAELLEKKNKILIEQSYALARAKSQEVADAQNAVSVKTIELARDGELTAAELEQIAVLENLVIVKKNAAAEASANANAMKEEAAAAKKAADAQKENKEQTDKVCDSTKSAAASTGSYKAEVGYLAKNFDHLSESGERARAAIGKVNSVRFSVFQDQWKLLEIIEKQTAALDGAVAGEIKFNEKLQETIELADSFSPSADKATASLVSMAQSGSYGIRGISDAGEEAIDTLEGIKYASMEAADALSDLAEDYKQKIYELQGDMVASLKMQKQDALDEIEDYYLKAGALGRDEYSQAKAAAEAYYNAKIHEQQVEDAKEAAEAYDKVGESAEKASTSVKKLSQTDLSNLTAQVKTLSSETESLGAFF